MAGVNPVVLIQLLQQYSHPEDFVATGRGRTFTFNRNHRTFVHRESLEEISKRKSYLPSHTTYMAANKIRDILRKSLSGRLGKVYIDTSMTKIAVPIDISTGNSGYGVLPTGSRISIPDGKFVRAFTYWEKVNDIDLSCFALDSDFNQIEFSWRTMSQNQSSYLTFSGDQTSGFNGGSEYFDINIDEMRHKNPNYRYIVFCNNVYSGAKFNTCICKAGFMVRETQNLTKWKGERTAPSAGPQAVIFDPKTVQTSFTIDSDSTFAYLFAIDLEKREMIWLNKARSDNTRVAGSTSMDFLKKYFEVTSVFNVADLYNYASSSIVSDPSEADVIVSDRDFYTNAYGIMVSLDSNKEIVHSWDFDKMLDLLQPAS